MNRTSQEEGLAPAATWMGTSGASLTCSFYLAYFRTQSKSGLFRNKIAKPLK